MRMALAGMNAVSFARFNMLKFLMQLTTDKVLFAHVKNLWVKPSFFFKTRFLKQQFSF